MCYKQRIQKHEYIALQELSLSQWRNEYKRELENIVREIFAGMEKIKQKSEGLKRMIRDSPWNDMEVNRL